MGQLRYLDETGQLRTLDLVSDKLCIGRDEKCDVRIDADLVSREHAQLIREPDGKWRLKDLGSRNHTVVNGQPIREVLLTSGDIVRIGDRILEYDEGSAPPTAGVREYLITDRRDPPGCEWIKVKEPVPLTLAQAERLGALVEHSGIAPRVADLSDVALSRLLIDLGAERGFVALKGDEAKGLELLSVRGFGRRTPTSPFVGVSQSFVYSGLLQHVAGRYPTENAAHEESDHNYPASALVAPLVSNGREIGVIYLDRPVGRRPFAASALHQLMCAGAVLGSALARAQRRLGALQMEHAPAYLAVNRRIQSNLLVLPAGGENFSVSTRLLQGCERCGDLQETILLDETRMMMMMTDAGGMGTSGFVQSMSIFSGLRVAVESQKEALNLGEAFEAVNRSLSARSVRQLVGCAAVLVDLTAGRLSYINAGLKAPLLLVGPQRLVTLEKTAPMLGADASAVYGPAFADLSAKFRVILHTDGLTDGLNPAGESFGEERLHETLLAAEAFDTPERMIDLMIAAFQEHLGSGSPFDDALILVLAHG